jgi:hypothetical protein
VSAALLDVLAGVGGAVLGVVAPAAVVGAVERALPLFLSLAGVDRAEATIAAPYSPRGVR